MALKDPGQQLKALYADIKQSPEPGRSRVPDAALLAVSTIDFPHTQIPVMFKGGHQKGDP